MANDVQRMWLHDESKTVNVLPYTTLDSILRRNSGDTNIDNFKNVFFQDEYDQHLRDNESQHEQIDNALNELSNRIDAVAIKETLATQTSDGLMSKEDKAKLDEISEGSMSYDLPIASDTSLGGVRIGSSLNIDGNGVLNIVTPTRDLDSLSDVTIEEPENNQCLIYSEALGRWLNQSMSFGNTLEGLGDVNVNNPTNNQILKYVVTSEGGHWENGATTAFGDLTYVDFADILSLFDTDDDFYVYDEGNLTY